jgi:hypothetical protein
MNGLSPMVLFLVLHLSLFQRKCMSVFFFCFNFSFYVFYCLFLSLTI